MKPNNGVCFYCGHRFALPWYKPHVCPKCKDTRIKPDKTLDNRNVYGYPEEDGGAKDGASKDAYIINDNDEYDESGL